MRDSNDQTAVATAVLPPSLHPQIDLLCISRGDLESVLRLLKQAEGFARFGGQGTSGAWISEAADLLVKAVYVQCLECADPVEGGDDRCAFHREQDSLRRADDDRDLASLTGVL
jgi:hypothetical protein